MKSLNKILVLGELVSKVQIHQTVGGKFYCQFKIRTSDKEYSICTNGKTILEESHNIVFFNQKEIEKVKTLLTNNKKVLIRGSLKYMSRQRYIMAFKISIIKIIN